MRALVAVGLALPFLLAGCLGAGASKSAPASSSASHTSAYGELGGMAMDEEGRPVAGVQVVAKGPLDAPESTTDAQGTFYFDHLLAGIRVLAFHHPRYETKELDVVIPANAKADAMATLRLLPSLQPYKTILPPMTGHYDCAAEAVIITGDCMEITSAVPPGYVSVPKVFTTKNAFFFNVSKGWTDVVVQLTWTTGGANQANGMHLYLAPANESHTIEDHHTKMAVAEGPSQPLTITLDNKGPAPTAEFYPNSQEKARLSPDGGEVLAIVYPRGQAADQADQVCEPDQPDKCFLGVGAALNIDLNVYVAIFYNGDPVPPGFTMVPS